RVRVGVDETGDQQRVGAQLHDGASAVGGQVGVAPAVHADDDAGVVDRDQGAAHHGVLRVHRGREVGANQRGHGEGRGLGRGDPRRLAGGAGVGRGRGRGRGRARRRRGAGEGRERGQRGRGRGGVGAGRERRRLGGGGRRGRQRRGELLER